MDHIVYKWARIFPQILWNSKPQSQVLEWGSNGHTTNMKYIFIKTSSLLLDIKQTNWSHDYDKTKEFTTKTVKHKAQVVGVVFNFDVIWWGSKWIVLFVWKIFFSTTGRLLAAVKPSINYILWLKLAYKHLKKVIVKSTTPWLVN